MNSARTGSVIAQSSSYTVFLVALLTVLESVPLAVVSLVPWVATAFLSASTTDYGHLIKEGAAELAWLASFLTVYVVVDSTRLWKRLSLLVLRWHSTRVRSLFVSLMAFAFVASLALPAAFVTFLLAAFIWRLVDNMRDDMVVVQARLHLRAAVTPKMTAPRRHEVASRDPSHPPTPLGRRHSPAARNRAGSKASQDAQLPEHRFPVALLRINEVSRQLTRAFRSACTESPKLRVLRAKKRCHSVDAADSQTSISRSGLHSGGTDTKSVTPAQKAPSAGPSSSTATIHTMKRSSTASLTDRRRRRSAPPLSASSGRAIHRASHSYPRLITPVLDHRTGWFTPQSKISAEQPSRVRTGPPPLPSVSSTSAPHSRTTAATESSQMLTARSASLSSKTEKADNTRTHSSGSDESSFRWTSASSSKCELPDASTMKEATCCERTVFQAIQPAARERQGHTCVKSRHELGETVYRRIQTMLMVGVAYTSIVAGECSFKSRGKLIIDDYYAALKKPSPLNMTVYLLILIPVPLISIMVFWFFVYHFYLSGKEVSHVEDYAFAIHEVIKEKLTRQQRITAKEVVGILMLLVIGLSLAIDTDRYFS
ncbi:uncharacterized protein LOC144119807 [Amblyomma americanum]